MFFYTGQARLNYANGLELTLENVQLRESEVTPGGLRQWAGTATARPPVDADNAQIELPDGSKGTVVVNNVRLNLDGLATAHVTLLGSGAPPSRDT